jgi:predicted amidohydrolase YtcJ
MDGATCRAPAVTFDFDDAPGGFLPPDWSGHGDLFVNAEEFANVVTKVEARGGQVVAHAIGDRALETALAGYERALGGARSQNGHRIDHNTFVRPDLLSRYDAVGVNAVVWAVFNACVERDNGWASVLSPAELGWLRQHTAIMAANPDTTVAFHSDVPHTEGNPFHQLLGLTELAQLDAETGEQCPRPSWMDGHQVSMDLALRMMTINAATVMGLGDDIGSIEPGKRADLIVIAANPLQQNGFELLDNQVHATLIDGAPVWCAEPRWCALLAR